MIPKSSHNYANIVPKWFHGRPMGGPERACARSARCALRAARARARRTWVFDRPNRQGYDFLAGQPSPRPAGPRPLRLPRLDPPPPSNEHYHPTKKVILQTINHRFLVMAVPVDSKESVSQEQWVDFPKESVQEQRLTVVHLFVKDWEIRSPAQG